MILFNMWMKFYFVGLVVLNVVSGHDLVVREFRVESDEVLILVVFESIGLGVSGEAGVLEVCEKFTNFFHCPLLDVVL